jgi:hypothetical protein
MPRRQLPLDAKEIFRSQAVQDGRPPAPARVRKEMRGLEKSLADRMRARAIQRARADQLAQAANRPLIELCSRDPRAIKASQASAQLAHPRKARAAAAPPPLEGLTPGVSSGSILNILVPPYDFDWVWSSQEPGSHAEPTGDRLRGIFDLHTDNVAACSAGVGVYFRPVAERALVRFSPYVRYGYYWVANSHFKTAFTSGFLGVYVSSVDLNFRNPSTDIDARFTVWDIDQFGNGPLLTDENEGLLFWPGSATVYFPAVRSRQYFVWTWGGVSSWGNDSEEPTWSQAYSNLWATTVFCVFEQ